MPYPLHLSRLTSFKSPAHSIEDSDYDSDSVLTGGELPPPVPRKNTPPHDELRRGRAKLVKSAKIRGDTCTSVSIDVQTTRLRSSPSKSFFSRFARRQPIQLPRLDTTIADIPPPKKSLASGLSTRTQYNKTQFQAEFSPLSAPPSRSISYNPSPQTEDVISPGTYMYNGEQMDVHGSGHYKHHPLVKNNSADVLWHGGYRSRMEPVSTVEEEDERAISSSTQHGTLSRSHQTERPKIGSLAGRMDSGTLIVDELDKVLAQQDEATDNTGNDISADVPHLKDPLAGLTMPRRRLPRSDTYHDFTPLPPLPFGMSRSGSLPLLPKLDQPTPSSGTTTKSIFDNMPLDLASSDHCSPASHSPMTPLASHAEPLRSHPPDQPTPIFSPSLARPRSADITFNTGIFALSSSLHPIHLFDSRTQRQDHRYHHHHHPQLPLSVDYPFYNPTKPPHAQFTSTHTFNSRGSDSWGDAKRWRCCCCGSLTIVEQGVCANLRCTHERCYMPACTGVVMM